MVTISETLKVIGGLVAFCLFVLALTLLTRPTPPPPGIITERWYDDQYVGGYFFAVDGKPFRVKARTYFKYQRWDWYNGEK